MPSRPYDWLQTTGFFPESYVLPPCFAVTAHRPYGKTLVAHKKKKYEPPVKELLQIQFPKSDWTDRAFGIIDPDLHSDIATVIARNWQTFVRGLFRQRLMRILVQFSDPGRSARSGTNN